MTTNRVLRLTTAIAVASALLTLGCKDSSAPSTPFTTLAGQWSTQDTVRYNYALVSDGSLRLWIVVNQYVASVVASTDSTYTFSWTSGTQQVFDSVAGQPASRSTTPTSGSPMFTAVVRGDTTILHGFGRMLTNSATATSVHSQRTLPPSECLVALGSIARSSPSPTCYVALHWTRTQ
jgi:hypothetical protein